MAKDCRSCIYMILFFFCSTGFADSNSISEIDLWKFPEASFTRDESQSLKIRQVVEKILKQMTLEEKLKLMGGAEMETYAIERLKIPEIKMSDAGLGIVDYSRKTTAFPSGVMMAATWNPELVERMAKGLATEARFYGKNLLLGPCVNIHRTAFGGRNFESFSEDPYLSAKMTAHFVSQFKQDHLMTATKHFALNNQEAHRMKINVHVSEQAMHEIYLPSFAAAVNAGTDSIMSAYNQVNGQFASENETLLNKILKSSWGFQGFVISDWGATQSTVASANNGLDLEMPWGYHFGIDRLKDALIKKEITERIIDDKARRLLTAMVSFNLVDIRENKIPSPVISESEMIASNTEFNLQAAREGIVLLKNSENILPLNLKKIKQIAVIGPNGLSTPYHGGGSASVFARNNISIFQGLTDRLKQTGIAVKFSQGTDLDWTSNFIKSPVIENLLFRKQLNFYDLGNKDENKNSMNESLDLAKNSDLVILALGNNPKTESENLDRESISLDEKQNFLLQEVLKINSNVVVVLNAGNQILMPWADHIKGILYAWYAGDQGGYALADILIGDVNPSGKSPISFTRKLEDTSDYENFPGNETDVFYNEGIFVGYRHLDQQKITARFPFGFGLSYSEFHLSDLQIFIENSSSKSPSVKVQISIKNISARDGFETVQVYVSEKKPLAVRPPQELKAFKKIFLKAAETQSLTLDLDAKAFAYFDEAIHGWKIQPDKYELRIGTSSQDIKLRGEVELKSLSSL